MTQFDIEALKKKYKKHAFFELTGVPEGENVPTLAKIDDFFELSHQVGYIENHFDEDDENEHFKTMILNGFIEASVEYADRQAFYNYIYEKQGDKFKGLFHLPSRTTLTLIGLDIAVRYYYDGGKEEDEQELFDTVLPELEKIYGDFCREQELIKSQQKEQEKQLEKNIFDCILSYKEDYLNATSQRAKERIVTKVQLELKANYGIISASDYRANKEFIRSTFEEQSN